MNTFVTLLKSLSNLSRETYAESGLGLYSQSPAENSTICLLDISIEVISGVASSMPPAARRCMITASAFYSAFVTDRTQPAIRLCIFIILLTILQDSVDN